MHNGHSCGRQLAERDGSNKTPGPREGGGESTGLHRLQRTTRNGAASREYIDGESTNGVRPRQGQHGVGNKGGNRTCCANTKRTMFGREVADAAAILQLKETASTTSFARGASAKRVETADEWCGAVHCNTSTQKPRAGV